MQASVGEMKSGSERAAFCTTYRGAVLVVGVGRDAFDSKATKGDGTVPSGAAHWSPLGDGVAEADATPATNGGLHDGYEHGAAISDTKVPGWVNEKTIHLVANLKV